MSTANCTQVTPECPVSATTYGYVPDLGANVVLLIIFTICLVGQLGLSIWARSWTFLVAMVGGCLLEVAGYIGRLIMHDNVWNSSGFQMQAVCLILGPSFIAGALYLSLKHIVRELGSQYSRLPARLYTWIFIGFDIVSFVTQAAGGGVAAGASDDNPSQAKIGNDMMVVGIAIQVVTMAICLVLAVDFALRYWRRNQNTARNSSAVSAKQPSFELVDQSHHGQDVQFNPLLNRKFRAFCIAESFAFLTVFIRCIYRLPEMVGGWGNPLMRKEEEFLVLDGMMIALASVTLTIFHPGYWFPPMTGRPSSSTKNVSSF